MSSLVRRVSDRIRVAPSQMFLSTDCLWLVVLDGVLLCPATGKQAPLGTTVCDAGDELFIGSVVRAVLDLRDGDEDRSVGLLLPLSMFLYSHYSIQLGDEYLDDTAFLRSAIELQKDLLLPAMEQDFALGAAPGRADGVAFWLPTITLRKIETAFEAAGVNLIAVLPRALAIAPERPTTADFVVADSDSTTCSIVKVEGGVAARVLSAARQEFENEDFRNAWEEQGAALLAESPVEMATASDWLTRSNLKRPLADYLFYTRRFLETVAGANRQRRTWAGAGLAVAAAFVLALPLVYQWAAAQRLESARDDFRQQARVAAAYQNEILDMEYEWGVVYEYPEVDIPGVLMTLNTVIRNSLTSFSLDETSIEIQGFTADPEQVTKQLVAQPLFEEIEQSRSISGSNSSSGDRFGLRLTLTDQDYPSYARKYDFK